MKRLLIFAGPIGKWANTASAAIFVSLIGAAPVANTGSLGLDLSSDVATGPNDEGGRFRHDL